MLFTIIYCKIIIIKKKNYIFWNKTYLLCYDFISLVLFFLFFFFPYLFIAVDNIERTLNNCKRFAIFAIIHQWYWFSLLICAQPKHRCLFMFFLKHREGQRMKDRKQRCFKKNMSMKQNNAILYISSIFLHSFNEIFNHCNCKIFLIKISSNMI